MLDSGATVELTETDTRVLVVLAVGVTYLQVVAARARVDSTRAQLDTANTLLQQARERRGVDSRHSCRRARSRPRPAGF